MKISQIELIFRQSFAFTLSSLKSRYRKTFAGLLWVLLNPIIMFGVQSLVFKKFLKLAIPDFYLFLVGGLMPWIFMSQTITMSATTLTNNSGILKAFNLHPSVLINSLFFDNFFNFILASVIITGPVIIYSDIGPQLGILLIPITILPMIIGSYALASLVSIINVFYRDTSFILSFVFAVLFYLTPIFYPVENIPMELRWIIEINPLYHFITPYRFALYQPLSSEIIAIWLKSMGWALGILTISILYWRKKKNELFVAI